jgi:L-seryl-tRNA(Ser) seleniumtransferase
MTVSTEHLKPNLLRAIPSVDALLKHPFLIQLSERVDRSVLRDHVRHTLEQVRAEIMAGRVFEPAEDLLAEIQQRVERQIREADRPSLRPVINATGVIIHTNLGRALLTEEAVRAIEQVARGYSNLEYDLAAGQRGRRDVHGEKLLKQLLNCEAALVVNNNAAAVLLVLNTLAEGGEVVVSRGELVEIGGSFRIPDIMAKSGAELREIGTTNRTRISDYEAAIHERTRMLLRVHRSNFRITGFTERPSLEEIVALGRNYGIPTYEDLGSGCLVDLSPWGVADEPLVQHSLAAGVDLCTFSGDKLLGGPQAGVIVGRKELVDRLRRNPLMRAVRPDKLTYAALEATLRLYSRGHAPTSIPTLQMLSQSVDHIRRRAKRFLSHARRACRDRIRFQLKPGVSVTGGGSAPDSKLETILIALDADAKSAVEMEQQLRAFNPPIVSRIEDDQVVLDLRTVRPEEEKVLLSALQFIASEPSTLR